MNKKILISSIAVIITIAFVLIFINNTTSTSSNSSTSKEDKIVEVTDNNQINKIKDEAYLSTLLQIKTFDSLNVSYESLLEVAMRLAGIFELYQISEDDSYTTYVPRTTIHELIYELSGVRIDNPIIIEDFYYLYDEKEDYYYIVPSGSEWLELTQISSIHYSASNDQYIVKCSAESISDYGIKTIYPNVELHLKYKASSSYIKYQLISIDVGTSKLEFLDIDDMDFEYSEGV